MFIACDVQSVQAPAGEMFIARDIGIRPNPRRGDMFIGWRMQDNLAPAGRHVYRRIEFLCQEVRRYSADPRRISRSPFKMSSGGCYNDRNSNTTSGMQ
jgi:hypothetical protein